MSPGRIGVIGLVLAVVGGAWATAAAFTGDDGGPRWVDAVMLEEARKQNPGVLLDVAEDGDDAPGGPDPTGDGSLDDVARGVGDGSADGVGAVQTAGNDGTSGSTLEDGLRRELVRERAASDALRPKLAVANAASKALRRQLARERGSDGTDDGVRASRSAPAPAPAPSGAWRGGGDSSGGGDT